MPKKIVVMGAAMLVAVAFSVAAFAAGGALPLGPLTRAPQPTYKGYYDGHKDTFLMTDVSDKAQATAMHINYSAKLAGVLGAPAQYFILGHTAAGQLSVFGSEPGEPDYNPLWEEFMVTWKAGVKPVLLVRDDQIKALAKAGKLTLRDAHIVLNTPITRVKS